MKVQIKWLLWVFFSLLLTVEKVSASGDSKMRHYTFSSWECMWGGVQLEKNTGEKSNSGIRFSAFFHAGEYLHYPLSRYFGLVTGLTIRNVGFVLRDDTLLGPFAEKRTIRSYGLGIPLWITAGAISRSYFAFAGVECEGMFHFKQKDFTGSSKSKSSEWFSRRVVPFQPSVVAGVHFPFSMALSVRYYWSDFLNTEFREEYEGVQLRPYAGIRSRMWQVSLSFTVKNKKTKKSPVVTPKPLLQAGL